MAASTKVANTIARLTECRQWRAAGGDVAYTTDPAWLVTMAVNRRAGWSDDPTHARGSCRPVAGRYPKRAEGDATRAVAWLAQRVNGTRCQVRLADLQCLPRHLRRRFNLRRVACSHEPEWVGQVAASCEECLVAWWYA